MLTENTFHFLSMGILLGLSAGLSPGPLLTLVLTQTIKYNKSEGIKVALSPLITDLPIILITLFIFKELSQFDLVLGMISFVGGAFVAYLGYESIKTKKLNLKIVDEKSQSIQKGIITNSLSPHPYLFWATVGIPLLFKAYEISLQNAIIFMSSFYVMLVGSKVTIAIIVSRTKVFMGQKAYGWIMKVLGAALLVFSLMFIYEGIKYLK
ncbi:MULTISPECIES: LysE family translocator [unclassified Saccharicrinis]|uniref:LysE family translocator n=1 Tax=unclassified Saccharicrinis TaxID=2646859 RepID=UPI003D3260E5